MVGGGHRKNFVGHVQYGVFDKNLNLHANLKTKNFIWGGSAMGQTWDWDACPLPTLLIRTVRGWLSNLKVIYNLHTGTSHGRIEGLNPHLPADQLICTPSICTKSMRNFRATPSNTLSIS